MIYFSTTTPASPSCSHTSKKMKSEEWLFNAAYQKEIWKMIILNLLRGKIVCSCLWNKNRSKKTLVHHWRRGKISVCYQVINPTKHRAYCLSVMDSSELHCLWHRKILHYNLKQFKTHWVMLRIIYEKHAYSSLKQYVSDKAANTSDIFWEMIILIDK